MGLGGGGGLLGVDLGDGVQVSGSQVGVALVGAGAGGDLSSEGGGGTGGHSPASIDDEQTVSLLQAVVQLSVAVANAVSGLATSVNVGVHLVGVGSRPVSGDGAVLVGPLVSGNSGVDSEPLNGSGGGVHVAAHGTGGSGQVGHAELVGGRRVIPDKVELSLGVRGGLGDGDGLDGVGKRSHEEVSASDIVAVVPVVDVHVVGGVTVGVSEAALQQVLLGGGEGSKVSEGANLGVGSPS